ncbi:hypothetical protein [Chloroflexus sp. Y-396-1]|uniref:hypothetical protein n=1 Tax=Chloroflexus sp. Y-396-1 TaxID=867845 RepID=UPI0004BCE5BE|nr:hypothetical protein [Chloroflexus sp. Y-396-1]
MRMKVLITVKTYPTISVRYDELVCTAGFREDGSWVRIYPIPFRKKTYDERYKKYDWITIDLERNERDFRPESYRPVPGSKIEVVGHIDTKRFWEERRRICLKKVYDNLAELIAEAKNPQLYTSLATFKPTEILDFYAEPTDREWDMRKFQQIQGRRKQLKLFLDEEEDLEKEFQIVRKLPYTFKYRFRDSSGKESNLMIEDWETGQLFWNCLERHEGNEQKAVEDVRRKYFDDFARTKDLYFFLGTTLKYHKKSPNPFIIIGTFHPPRDEQLRMF